VLLWQQLSCRQGNPKTAIKNKQDIITFYCLFYLFFHWWFKQIKLQKTYIPNVVVLFSFVWSILFFFFFFFSPFFFFFFFSSPSLFFLFPPFPFSPYSPITAHPRELQYTIGLVLDSISSTNEDLFLLYQKVILIDSFLVLHYSFWICKSSPEYWISPQPLNSLLLITYLHNERNCTFYYWWCRCCVVGWISNSFPDSRFRWSVW
jgi:hypothetical protein